MALQSYTSTMNNFVLYHLKEQGGSPPYSSNDTAQTGGLNGTLGQYIIIAETDCQQSTKDGSECSLPSLYGRLSSCH